MGTTFCASPSHSLGIEVEANLVDINTGALANVSSAVLGDACRQGGFEGDHPKLKHELFECTVEVITGVCDSVSQARKDLAASFDEVRAIGADHGATLISSGTHPFTHWADLVVSPVERYHQFIEQMQWPVKRLAITGVHYHVGVRSPDKAIWVMNALTQYLPYFLAVSASSPYWHSFDTGMASVRTKIFESLPTAGLPPPLADWAEFDSFMDTLIAAGAISSVREVWWDVRPHPNFGTVELRMCDAPSTLGEVCALAALAQCLVAWFESLIDNGYTLPTPNPWLLKQNKWLAARYGLDGQLIADAGGTRVDVRQGVEDLISDLLPVARRLGCEDELSYLRHILEVGNSAIRQRTVVAAGGDTTDVVQALIREFATDEPGR